MTTAPVAIIMGSQSDWDTMRHAADTLTDLGVAFDARIVSAHRTPDRLFAGLVAGLAGVLARRLAADLARLLAGLLAFVVLDRPAAVRLPECDRVAAPECLELICARLGFPGTDTGHVDHDRINESSALATSPPLPIIRAFFLGSPPRLCRQ